MLASYFSQAKESSSVPVDYCPVKFVKKPAGARPGMVTYDNYRTLYVTPEEGLVKKLLIRSTIRKRFTSPLLNGKMQA